MRLQRIFKKEEISWAALVLEIFSVTLSVLVALAIGNWHEERQRRKQVDQALHAIAAECEGNRRMLERRLAYYLEVRNDIQRAIEEQGPDGSLSALEKWRGLQPVMLRDSAYHTAIATEAFSHMDFTLAGAISQVYSLHEFYRTFLDKIMDQMLAGRFENLGMIQRIMEELTAITRDGIKIEAQVKALIEKEIGRRTT